MSTIIKDEKAKLALKRVLEAQQVVLHQLQEDTEQKIQTNDDEVSTNMEANKEDYETPEEAKDKDFCSAG